MTEEPRAGEPTREQIEAGAVALLHELAPNPSAGDVMPLLRRCARAVLRAVSPIGERPA